MLILWPQLLKMCYLATGEQAEVVVELDVPQNHFGEKYFSAVMDEFLKVVHALSFGLMGLVKQGIALGAAMPLYITFRAPFL